MIRTRKFFGIMLLSALSLVLTLPARGAMPQRDRAQGAGAAADGEATRSGVPRLVKYSGVVKDSSGEPRTGPADIRFAIYAEAQGGEPLWEETQSVTLDAQGRFTVLLGATQRDGLTPDLFSSGEPRWLGTELPSQDAAPAARVLLVSVPYALKAGDAETLGGRPASHFILSPDAPPLAGTDVPGAAERPPAASESTGALISSRPESTVLSGLGTPGFLAKFIAPHKLGNSILLENKGLVGVNNPFPTQRLDVLGNIKISGNGNGLIFADGSMQSTAILPGAGTGTVTQVNSGPGIIGGPITTAGTLGLDLSFTDARYLQPNGNGSALTNVNAATLNGLSSSSFLQPNGNGSALTSVNAATFNGLFPSAFVQTGAANNMFTGGASFGGSVSAPSFLGSGSGLTNVNALTLNGLPASAFVSTTVVNNTFVGGATFGGSVGIGTTSPSAPLEVAGNVRVSGTGSTLAVGGNVVITGTTVGSVHDGTLSVTQGGADTAATYACASGAPATCKPVSVQSGSTEVASIDQTGIVTAGGVALPPSGTATAAAGFNSNPLNLTGSAFDGAAAQNQQFSWQVFPTANNSAGASGEMHLLFGAGSTAPADTGLFIDHTGKFNFAAGQTFPGSGSGGVTTGLGLLFSAPGKLAIDPTVVPQLTAANNNFVGDLTANLMFAASIDTTAPGAMNTFAGPVTATQLDSTGAGVNTFAGHVKAPMFIGTGIPAFTGDGSGLTNVIPGAGSANYIQNGTTQQAAANFNISGNGIIGGNLELPDTSSSSVGMITLGGVPFLHNFPGGLVSANTFVGEDAGNTLPSLTGQANTAVGAFSLSANTTGAFNSAFGVVALDNNTSGSNNSAFGERALDQNTTGGDNSAFGFTALFDNSTGDSNSAFGSGALAATSTATGYSAFGFNALHASTSGIPSSAFGFNALAFNTTGVGNNAFGADALQLNISGQANSAFGSNALQRNTTANSNSAFGDSTLGSNTTGANNSAFGQVALFNNTIGGNNSAFGYQALLSNTTDGFNSAFGFGALSNLTSGGANTAIGTTAGASLMTGSNNIYIGGDSITASESNTIRIGQTQMKTFIAGNLNTLNGLTVLSGPTTVSGGATIDSLNVTGMVTAGSFSANSKAFKIDHPLDPEHKYLYHSSVESPDMKNVYDGVVTLNAEGQAWVELPAYFEALNRDFRYQLTAIGAPGPNLYIAREIQGNRFQIAGGKPVGKVSWQVTGIRQDAFAEKHRIKEEEDKPAAEQGYYLYPDAYGQPEEKGIAWARAHHAAPQPDNPKKDEAAAAHAPQQ